MKAIPLFFLTICLACVTAKDTVRSLSPFEQEVTAVLKADIMKEASWATQQVPVTVSAEISPRSAGGKHDFYSEGDYWWPDPTHPGGAYIQRDGMTNPDNFVAHRLAMIRFSKIIGALASAYRLTGDKKYSDAAAIHLRAWFVDTSTKMSPHLLYAQAIKGVATGRGIGIIDAIQLMEVARGTQIMHAHRALDQQLVKGVKNWFADFLTWLTTHKYGKDEMNAKNNHGTCWVMQVAAFASLTGNDSLLDFCRNRYKTVLLPEQMATDGSFPLELRRTKPYGYSIFNLDAMTMVCHILSDKQNDLWQFSTADGKNIRKGIQFLYPYVKNKEAWPFPKDVMYWNEWPVAQPFLVFGAYTFNDKDWLRTWKTLDHSPQVEEVIRNLPVRHPLIWLN